MRASERFIVVWSRSCSLSALSCLLILLVEHYFTFRMMDAIDWIGSMGQTDCLFFQTNLTFWLRLTVPLLQSLDLVCPRSAESADSALIIFIFFLFVHSSTPAFFFPGAGPLSRPTPRPSCLPFAHLFPALDLVSTTPTTTRALEKARDLFSNNYQNKHPRRPRLTRSELQLQLPPSRCCCRCCCCCRRHTCSLLLDSVHPFPTFSRLVFFSSLCTCTLFVTHSCTRCLPAPCLHLSLFSSSCRLCSSARIESPLVHAPFNITFFSPLALSTFVFCISAPLSLLALFGHEQVGSGCACKILAVEVVGGGKCCDVDRQWRVDGPDTGTKEPGLLHSRVSLLLLLDLLDPHKVLLIRHALLHHSPVYSSSVKSCCHARFPLFHGRSVIMRCLYC